MSARHTTGAAVKNDRGDNDLEADDSSAYSHRSLESVTSVLTSAVVSGISQWKVTVFGQFMALVLASRGAFTALAYRECGLSAPTFNIAVMYAFLTLHLVYVAFHQRKKRLRISKNRYEPSGGVGGVSVGDDVISPSTTTEGGPPDTSVQQLPGYSYKLPCTRLLLKTPWWFYLFVAFLDVEANYLTYLALRFTSFKSATLLDCIAIPSAMVTSRFVLRRRYTWVHLLGATVCLVGSMIAILSDYEEEEAKELERGGRGKGRLGERSNYPHALGGDFMAIFGGVLYGIVDTLSEKAVKRSGQAEYLGMIGLFGVVIATIQVCILEREDVAQIFLGSACAPDLTFALMSGIVVSFYIYYIGMARFLVVSEAALLNLSLLTADVWAVLFAVLEENEIPPNLFFASLAVIVSGVFVYEMVPSPIVDADLMLAPHDLHLTSSRSKEGDTEGEKLVELPPSFHVT